MNIQYVAYTWRGRRVEGILDADSLDAAYDELHRRDLIPYRMKEERPPRPLAERYPGLFRPRPQALIDFSRQMASLLRSGVSLRRALVTLASETRSVALRYALLAVVREVEGGGRFADAMERHRDVFPPFYTRLIRVGEAAGGLVVTFQRLADSLQRRKDVQDKIRNALTYPGLSLLVAGIAGIILVTFTLPRLLDLLEQFGGELPFATRLLRDISDLLRSQFIGLFSAIIGLIVGLALYFRTRQGARLRDRVLLRMPVVGPVILRSNMQSLTTTLKTLIDEGVPLVEALRLSADSLSNLILREAMEAATRAAESGTSLGEAFRQQPLFPPLLVQGMVTGDLAGTLPETLAGMAEFYQAESERSVGAATELIQPLLIILVASVVGFVAVAIMSGIFSSIGNVRT